MRRSTPGSVLLLLSLAIAAPALGQVVQVTPAELSDGSQAPTRLTQSPITLGEAVGLTLRQSPVLSDSAARIRAAAGRVRETRGLFDPVVRFAPTATFTLKEMAPFLKGREAGKRDTIRIIRTNFTILTLALRDIINQSTTVQMRCPSGFRLRNGQLDMTLYDVDPSGRDKTEVRLLGVGGPVQSVLVELTRGLTFDLSDICRTQPDRTLGVIADELQIRTLQRIDQSGGLGLGGILTSVAQIPQEARLLQEEITRTVAYRAQLALDRLGPIADDELKRNVTLDLGFSKLLRNGTVVDAGFQMQSQEQNFVDKPLDPTFGGFETPPQFFSSVSGTLTVPLARGRGRASVGANERAAEEMAAAEREQFLHEVSNAALGTVQAYVNLIAAQETVQQLTASVTRQQQIFTLSQARVAAGDLAQADLARVRASAAGLEGSLAQAREALISARIALADQMGVRVDTLDEAPSAAAAFAQTSTTSSEVERLIAQALATRRDARAAEARRRAASALATAARADARPLLDLSVTGGMSNFYESPFFKYFPDEREPIITSTSALPTAPVTGSPVPPRSPVRYYEPKGYGRAIRGRYEPFATVKVTFELPLGNRTAKGRLAQAAANVTDAEIQSADLRRTVAQQVTSTGEAVRRSAASIVQWEAAVASGAETLSGRIRLFQTGDTTLIDTLTTEQGLTADYLQLVRQRQLYLTALARLRHETGELVSLGPGGSAAEMVRFDPTSFATR